MQKAFIQYLQSLAQCGIQELPIGDEEIQTHIAQSVSATDEWLAGQSAAELASVGPTPAEATHPVTLTQQSQERIASVERALNTTASGVDVGVTSGIQPQERSEEFNGLTAGEKLATLDAQVRECKLCPELVDNRTQTVFGVGSASARLCFLGEAPGADEDRLGEPFVGAAGQLLTRIIEACKMTREEVYILNTLKCRPPNNRNPTNEECARCSPFLEQQLKVIQPEFICCLGGIAAKHLLNTELSVGRLRGKWHLYNGIKVMVTYHPAYLLRNPDAKRQVWNDMKFLMNEMGHDYA